jgi:hypothetical protein
MNNYDSLKVYYFDKKIRLGCHSDGGYVLGDLDEEYDCYISAGISNEESFSRDFIHKYNMLKENCYGFDGTINNYPYEYTDKIQFIKKNIHYENNDNNTNLSFLLEKYNNIFLKMDIEGGEYAWLLNIKEPELNKFKQIVIEFHGITDRDYSWLADFQDKIKCLEKLANTHYLIHAHGNNHGKYVNNIPDVIELTYVNKNYFISTPELNTQSFPIPNLDYPNKSYDNDYDLNSYPFVSKNTINLTFFEKKIFSQNGEDGVTMKLIDLLYSDKEENNNFYVEIGVEDGNECNTRIVREKYNWKGLQMDGKNKNIYVEKEFVTKENIVDLFVKYNVPKNINILSIDIDFNDFYVLQKILDNYICDIIICEYNATHLPTEDKVVIYDKYGQWDGTNYFGVSLLTLDKLCKLYNYTIVYCNQNGVNCFIINNDIINNKNLRFVNMGHISKIYRPADYGNGPNGGHRMDPYNRKYITFDEAITSN